VSKKGVWVNGVVVGSRNEASGHVAIEHVDWGSEKEENGRLQKTTSDVLLTDIRWAVDRCDDVVFQKEVGRAGPFNSQTENERLARDPLAAEDWQSISENKWVRSGVIDRMVSHFNMASDNSTVLVTNIALEHALFPNAKEILDVKAFVEQNDPTKIGVAWHEVMFLFSRSRISVLCSDGQLRWSTSSCL
jgi:hypothetical protein